MAVLLHHIIASSKEIRTRTEAQLTVIYHEFQKLDLYNGFTRTYVPLSDTAGPSEQRAPENKPVLRIAADQIRALAGVLATQVNLQARIDEANTKAGADIVVDGVPIAQNVPATTLLGLETRMKGILAELKKLPTLEDGVEWVPDQTPGRWRGASPALTVTTAKENYNHVLAAATDKHPAQVQMLTRDVPIGTWTKVTQSGAVPVAEKLRLLARAEALSVAIREARERANEVIVDETISTGSALSAWLFAPR